LQTLPALAAGATLNGVEIAPGLSRLPATQDEFEAWCATFDGSELGRFEFL